MARRVGLWGILERGRNVQATMAGGKGRTGRLGEEGVRFVVPGCCGRGAVRGRVLSEVASSRLGLSLGAESVINAQILTL
jgi:hypothetical protein